MKHFNSSLLVKSTLLVYMAGAAVPSSFAQQFASTASARALRGLQVSSDPGFVEDQQVSLKDALNDLKKRYNIRFAYRAGLLEGKTVSAAWLEEGLAAEQTLGKLLDHCKLQYKKINKKQFTIFASNDSASLLAGVVTPMDAAATSETVIAEERNSPNFALTGTVTSSDDGMTMPGVNVVVKGTVIGTTTDGDGKYSLSVPDEGGTLVFSFIGYATQEVAFTSTQTTVNVTMEVEMSTLGEVVVTALGIERDKSALAYSVTEVKGTEFTQARENNVANALTGKIAGVNATGISTGPGGSSRVIIRGNGSLTGANQPLYVINGMPIDNTTPGGSAQAGAGAGNVDRGDGIGGINPDDIESISVLKGGTAAALYGSRAANGVILITTKKGKSQKGVGVEYNTTFTMENVAVKPDWQYEYGQGIKGAKPSSQDDARDTGRKSWGAKIDGSEYIGVDGKMHPYSPVKDNIERFYRTGTSFTNTLAFTGGSQALNYRFSVSDMNSRSILPNSKFNRKTANLNLNGKFGEKITVEALAQYNLEKAENRATAGDASGNPNWLPYMIANTADVEWVKPGYDANGDEIRWNDAGIATNGYYVINKYHQEDTKNRFIGQMSIGYEIVKGLTLKGTVSRDFYNYNYEYAIPSGNAYVLDPVYTAYKTDVSETNGMLTLNYNTKIGENFTISALAGGNQRRYQYNEIKTTGRAYIVDDFYSVTNLTGLSQIPLNQRTAINSVFGSADLGWKDMLFLTLTGRQDWFSTLSPANNSIFYPSVGGSFVLSEAITMPQVLDYVKFRASWAEVGGATPDPYAINLTYSMAPSSGLPLQQVTQDADAKNVITNTGLRPLTSTTYEVGFDTKLFQNRLAFDFTFYDRKTTDDIVKTAISGTSGYSSAILNIGELRNRGIELLVTGTPIKKDNFSWDVSYNVAYNSNKVIKLADGLNEIEMARTVNNWGILKNIVGRPFGTITGTRRMRDADGNIVFNPNGSGFALATPYTPLGQGVPPLTMGITNDFHYKNFNLSILVDGKFGNKVLSLMDIYGTRMGKTKYTLPGREDGLDLVGVLPNGEKFEGRVEPANLEPYYNNERNYSEVFVQNGSFVKLRQIILGYNFPVSRLPFKLQGATISFVARNLLILYKETDNFDPEQSYSNSSNQGFESFGLPRTRSYGVNLSVKF